MTDFLANLVVFLLGCGVVLGVGIYLHNFLFRGIYDTSKTKEMWHWVAPGVTYWLLITIFGAWCMLDLNVVCTILIIIICIVTGFAMIGVGIDEGRCPKCGAWNSYKFSKTLRSGHYDSNDTVYKDILNTNGEVVGSYETKEERTHYWSKDEHKCKKCGRKKTVEHSC